MKHNKVQYKKELIGALKPISTTSETNSQSGGDRQAKEKENEEMPFMTLGKRESKYSTSRFTVRSRNQPIMFQDFEILKKLKL